MTVAFVPSSASTRTATRCAVALTSVQTAEPLPEPTTADEGTSTLPAMRIVLTWMATCTKPPGTRFLRSLFTTASTEAVWVVGSATGAIDDTRPCRTVPDCDVASTGAPTVTRSTSCCATLACTRSRSMTARRAMAVPLCTSTPGSMRRLTTTAASGLVTCVYPASVASVSALAWAPRACACAAAACSCICETAAIASIVRVRDAVNCSCSAPILSRADAYAACAAADCALSSWYSWTETAPSFRRLFSRRISFCQ